MKPGPLRRMTGSLGLVGLVPIAVLLLDGRLTTVEAAQRAVVLLLVVVTVGRVFGAYLTSIATRFDPGPSVEHRLRAALRARAETGGDEVEADA